MIDINEGRSGALALPGFVLVIAAILFIFISPLVSIILVPIAICCFLVTTGIELDPATKCYRPYYGLFSLKFPSLFRLFDDGAQFRYANNHRRALDKH